MHATRKNIKSLLISATSLSLLCAFAFGTASNADPNMTVDSTVSATSLTLQNLKNGSYEIPNDACGYKVVKLRDGKGSTEGMEVVFGRASFGKISDKREPGAVVHLAYKDEMLGWMQQVVFVVARGNKLLQIAELGLDDREQLKNVEFRDGDVLLETYAPEENGSKFYKKCTKAQLIEKKEGTELTATQFNWYTTEGNQEPAPRLVSLRH